MKISIIGVGFVGLVAGACFANYGNDVICVDTNKKKIDQLKKGIVEIYEPGLSELVNSNLKNKRISFTTDINKAIKESEIIFICVGTPSNPDGSANLSYIYDVAKSIGKNLNNYKIIVNKSTSPIGTSEEIKKIIKKYSKQCFDIASNPEFLKQGNAVNDFMHPDRTIIGLENNDLINIFDKLYSPFFRLNNRIIYMDIKSAEMTKYASNSFLATKISFINEMANICELYGADIEKVRLGMAADTRIGNKFLYPGIGYGGSCFPKDVSALIKMGEDKNYNPLMLKATKAINDKQIINFINKISKRYNNKLKGKTFAIWGLAFKPKTNDMRDAPSIKIINYLLSKGATINAYDPEAMKSAKEIFKNKIHYCNNQKQALKDVDGLIITAEWSEFRNFDFKVNGELMKQRIIFDGRNQFNLKEMEINDFDYYSMGNNTK